jgi:aspartate aminotransferase
VSASFLSAELSSIKMSPTTQARARARALAAAGRDIVDFTVGEPDLATPENIVAAAQKALRDGDTKYPPMGGTAALRQAICAKFQRDNGLTVVPEDVVVANGAKHLIYSAFACTVDAGDEVIVPAPYWVSYPDMVRLKAGVPVIVDCGFESGFKLTPAALERAITPRTKWLVLNSPNNPTGAIYTAAELAALAEVLTRHPHVWLMTDEIYEHFNYSGQAIASPLVIAPHLRSRSLIVNGVSKTYAMTGWRIGFGAGPRILIKAIETFLSQSAGGACTISQAAAVEALMGPQDFVASACNAYRERRDRMVEGLANLLGLKCFVPDGAFYVFATCAELIGRRTAGGEVLASDVDVANRLLDEAGIAVVSGDSYGASPYLRISFATGVERIDEGCRRIRAFCVAAQ